MVRRYGSIQCGHMALMVLAATVGPAACASGGGPSTTDVAVSSAPQQLTTASGQNIRFNTSTTTVAVTETIPVGADSAFNLVLKVYRDLQIPTTNLDARQRMAGNPSLKIRRRMGGISLSKYIDCGHKDGVSNADEYDIVLNVGSAIGPSGPASSTISTRVDGVATHPIFSTQTACSTTGELEMRIALAVRSKAAGGK